MEVSSSSSCGASVVVVWADSEVHNLNQCTHSVQTVTTPWIVVVLGVPHCWRDTEFIVQVLCERIKETEYLFPLQSSRNWGPRSNHKQIFL
jgi:hypothetical protein